MKNVWMKGVLVALLGAVVLVGCGGADEEASVSGVSGNNTVHTEGDGHNHKPGETH
jgi:hypothetical protein